MTAIDLRRSLAVPPILFVASLAAPQEAPLERAGLRAELFASAEFKGEPLAVRSDADLQFLWDEEAPDLRLPRGPFSIRWTGKLIAPDDGEYRFGFLAAGAVRLLIDGRTIVEGESMRAGWIAGPPVKLDAGERALAVEFRRISAAARLGLYWESATFPLEPVGEENFLLPEGPEPAAAFERGLRIVRRRGCVSCHDHPGAPERVRAPSKGPGERTESTTGAEAKKLLADEGRRLVATLGCIACHRSEGLGGGTPLAGRGPERGPLDGGGGGLDGHEPELRWEKGEREQVRAFLASRAETKTASQAAPSGPEKRSCARGSLAEAERRDAEHFLTAALSSAKLPPAEEGRLLTEEKGCLSCHPRGPSSGLDSFIPALTRRFPALTGHEAELRPPSLASAGDKFLPETLREILRGRAAPRRPWLQVRMPAFQLSEREEEAIAKYFEMRDRVPDRTVEDAPPDDRPAESRLFAAGHILAGPNGLSCTSCHIFGSFRPRDVPANARGSDLLGIGKRLRESWFLRWMRNPSRIAPGIEMPAISMAFPGVLDGRLDHQLAALWKVLNSEGFSVPARTGTVREIIVAPGDDPSIIHDVFELKEPFGIGWAPRGLALGLPGGQNVLIDLGPGAAIAWWTGPFARQFTEGKSWFWQPAGIPAIPRIPAVAAVGLRSRSSGHGGRLQLAHPLEEGEGRLESWRIVEKRAVELVYILRFDGNRRLRLREVWEALRDGAGLVRRIEIEGLEASSEPVLLLALPPSAALSPGAEEIALPSPAGEVRIGLLGLPRGSAWRESGRIDGAPAGARLFEAAIAGAGDFATAGDTGTAGIVYRPASQPVLPPHTSVAAAPARRGRRVLDIVPGYRAVLLPLDPSIMPTSFAIRSDGTVFFTSLKGEVFALLDRDGDGEEDDCSAVSPLLSAPFGLLAEGDRLLVSHKPELLGLTDRDGDGRFETASVVAAGWGISHDYHDWTFGIVERAGVYHVLLGSDYSQAKRSEGSSRYRGHALRISSGGTVESIARGLRFTAGIARHKSGEIFFSDNQGDRNPFNEINHLTEGSLYGVPARGDPREDFEGPQKPPAVVFPHPWTRSVNGIAFLDGGGRFGLHEGHGFGCEYDNRLLVRFTLESVGETYQGAAYPLSREPGQLRRYVPNEPEPAREPAFLGPLSAGVSPRGRIYAGNIWDSGWLGGANVGSIVILEPEGKLPFGIREVRLLPGGFALEFTGEVDRAQGSDPKSFQLTAYRRIWKGGYATPDQERHSPPVSEAAIEEDGRTVRLKVEPLREGFLYEIHARAAGRSGEAPWPGAAYYTLNKLTSPGTSAHPRRSGPSM